MGPGKYVPFIRSSIYRENRDSAQHDPFPCAISTYAPDGLEAAGVRVVSAQVEPAVLNLCNKQNDTP